MFIPYELGQEVYFQDQYTRKISKAKISAIVINENGVRIHIGGCGDYDMLHVSPSKSGYKEMRRREVEARIEADFDKLDQ